MGRRSRAGVALVATVAVAAIASAGAVECSRCSGLSADACLDVLDSSLASAEWMDRLTLLEEVFAGDSCEELADDHCLSQLEAMLGSLSTSQRLDVLTDACAVGALDSHLGETTAAIARVSSPEAAAAMTFYEHPPLAATTMMMLGAEEVAAKAATPTEAACGAAQDDELETAFFALTQHQKLEILEEAYPGDICEQLSDASCLAALQGLVLAAPRDDRRVALERACAATGDADASASMFAALAPDEVAPAAAAEDVSVATPPRTPVLASLATTADDASELAAVASCGACDGAASDDECLTTLNGALTKLSDADRLNFERAAFLSGPDDVALQQAAQGAAVPQLHEDGVVGSSETSGGVQMAMTSGGESAQLCAHVSDRDCLATLDLKLALLNKKQRLGVLASACGRGILATADDAASIAALAFAAAPAADEELARMTSRSSCSACEGLTNNACLELLDGKVGSMSNTARLGFEKTLLGASTCDQVAIGDDVCLSFLDAKVAGLSKKERLQTWELACSYNIFSASEPASPAVVTLAVNTLAAEATCSACDGTTDKACLSTLDAAYDALTDKTRLTFERAVLDADGTTCDSLSDKACLSALDALATDLSDKTRLSTWRDACADGLLDATSTATVAATAVLAVNTAAAEATCSACDGTTDKACLSTLDAAYDALTDKTRLTFERAVLDADGTTCDSLSDKACLSALDALATDLTDKTRLSTWRDACADGLLDSTATAAATTLLSVDNLGDATSAFGATGAVGAIAVASVTVGAAVGVVIRRRNRHAYDRLPNELPLY